ncbi:MAG: RNA polymerase sigma factor [bacterium]|jgi:RNA polymerase sigma factor (sigma-70 family)
MSELKMPQIPPLTVVISDEELVTKAQLGDREALGELLRRHSNHAYYIARQMAPRDYEDVVQDACVKATEAIGQCRGSFGAWFTTIVRRQAIDFYRAQKRVDLNTQPIETMLVELADTSSTHEFEIDEGSLDLADQLAELMGGLTSTQREVIAALYTEASATSQSSALIKRASHRIGKTEGAVRNALFQIRRAIQERAPVGLIEEIIDQADRDDILMVVLQHMVPELFEDQLRSQLHKLAELGLSEANWSLAAIHTSKSALWELGFVVWPRTGAKSTPTVIIAACDYGRKSRAELLEWAAAIEIKVRQVCDEIGLRLSEPTTNNHLRIASSRSDLARLMA